MRNQEDKTLARNISLLVFVNMVCWGPVISMSAYGLTSERLADRSLLKVLAVFVVPSNSLINPFLYCLCRRSFRLFIFSLFERRFGGSWHISNGLKKHNFAEL